VREPTREPVSRGFVSLPWPKLKQGVFSTADQALSVGGMFLANVALARTVSKKEYGMFALSYSLFTFLAGLHNAALLETYTVYGAGRYRQHSPPYAWLIWRSNAWLGLALTAALLVAWRILSWQAPALAAGPLLGLALTGGVLLTASLLRRMLYVQRKPRRAANLSLIFFVTVAVLLWASVRAGMLNGFSAFLIVALGWIVAGLFLRGEFPQPTALEGFAQAQPNHWPEHWKYARWVLATAFVFQLTTQGYYWLVAGFLSLKQVAELRAIYMLIGPVDQVFTAITMLILPVLALHYASKQMAEFFSVWKAYLLTFILISAGFAGAAWVLGGIVIHLLYGGRFDDVSSLFSILALLPLVMGTGNTMNVALKSAERPNAVLYAYLASGATTLLAGIPLVTHFGLRGAVYGMLVSAAVYTATLGVGFKSYLHTKPYAIRLTESQTEASLQ
jgi:O-antigen/teichoic acid export membrane protein